MKRLAWFIVPFIAVAVFVASPAAMAQPQPEPQASAQLVPIEDTPTTVTLQFPGLLAWQYQQLQTQLALLDDEMTSIMLQRSEVKSSMRQIETIIRDAALDEFSRAVEESL